MSLPEHARAALIEFRGRVERLVPGRLVGFRAFGSYVRGEAHEDSDLDVLVLVEALARDEHRSIMTPPSTSPWSGTTRSTSRRSS